MDNKIDLYTTNEEADLLISNLEILRTEIWHWCYSVNDDHRNIARLCAILEPYDPVIASTEQKPDRIAKERAEVIKQLRELLADAAVRVHISCFSELDTDNLGREFKRRDGGRTPLIQLFAALVSDATMRMVNLASMLKRVHEDCTHERMVARATGLPGIHFDTYERAVVRSRVALERKIEISSFWLKVRGLLRDGDDF